MLILFAQEMMGLVSTQRRSSYGQPWGDEEICMSSYEVCRHRGCRGKVPMYHPSSVSANQRAASLLFDQSEPEKLAHEDDGDDEFFTVTIQGGYSKT